VSLFDVLVRAKQRLDEQRRSQRHLVQCPAWIDTGRGAPLRNCTICDVSETGARIMIESPETVPTDCWLLASSDGASRRRCKVIWQSDDQIGVSYLDPPGPNPDK
jgi:PilZ domain